MKTTPKYSWQLMIGLLALVALTRFDHFGTAVALPDASLAVFFLGGLLSARSSLALPTFIALLVEAALVDYYAISIGGVSDWCVTPGYGFLALVYAVVWIIGRGFAPYYALTRQGFFRLLLATAFASSMGFVLSNWAFYEFSGRYDAMSIAEYATRVSPYFVSYTMVALFYVSLAIGIRAIIESIHHLFHKKSAD